MAVKYDRRLVLGIGGALLLLGAGLLVWLLGSSGLHRRADPQSPSVDPLRAPAEAPGPAAQKSPEAGAGLSAQPFAAEDPVLPAPEDAKSGLHGRVLGPDGPVPGADVFAVLKESSEFASVQDLVANIRWFMGAFGSQRKRGVWHCESSPEGRFRFPFDHTRVNYLYVDANASGAAHWGDLTSDACDLVVPSGPVLHIAVRDAITGEGIEEATVDASASGIGSLLTLPTRSDGTLILPLLPGPPVINVRPDKKGYAPAKSARVSGTTVGRVDLAFVLRAMQPVAWELCDPASEPWTPARLAEALGEESQPHWTLGSKAPTSPSLAAYTMTGFQVTPLVAHAPDLPGKGVRLETSDPPDQKPPWHLCCWLDKLLVGTAEVTPESPRVLMAVEKPGRREIRFRVERPDGTKAVEACVFGLQDRYFDPKVALTSTRSETAACAIQIPATLGRFLLSLACEGCAPLTVETRAEDLEGRTFVLVGQSECTGRVVDSAGEGIRGAEVRAWMGGIPIAFGGGSATDEKGAFAVRIPDADYSLLVQARQHGAVRLDFLRGQRPQDPIVVPRGFTQQLTGFPGASDWCAVYYDQGGRVIVDERWFGMTRTSRGGELNHVPAGTVRIDLLDRATREVLMTVKP